MSVLDLSEHPIIPVVVLNDARRARMLGETLVAGGIHIAEVRFRTAAASQVIRAMSAVPGLVVEAGTVLDVRQLDRAAEMGARFIVSPGLNADVVARSTLHGLTVVPGAVTPTEIMAALGLGLTNLKFFPANVYGGPSAIRALGAPFPQVRFVPTGGISPANLDEYLRLPNVVAAGGSWMVPQELVDAGDMEAIRRLSRDASSLVARVRAHDAGGPV